MKIKLTKRDVIGKKVKELRNEGLIPANIYGPKRESMNVCIDNSSFRKIFQEAGGNVLLDVEIEGEGKSTKALVKEIQADPIKGSMIHVSFYEPDLTKTVKAEIPLEFVGVSPAVKNNIGFLVTPVNTISVSCLPSALPEKLTIDISNLTEIGDSINVSDIKLPENVEFTHDISENMAVANIVPPQKAVVVETKTDEESEVGEGGEDGELPEEGEAKEGEGKSEEEKE